MPSGAVDPVLARLIDRLEPIDMVGWRARWSLDNFGSLARAIVGQQIATRAATAIFGRLQAFIGDRDDAMAIAGASDSELRSIGLSAAKAAAFARSCRANPRRPPPARPAGPVDGRGGPSSAHGRPRNRAVDSRHIPARPARATRHPAGRRPWNQARRTAAYGLEKMPSEHEVRRLGEAWRQHRSLATAYLYKLAVGTSRSRRG
jgi:DNA-3-methyladenine glycosylase II